MNARLSAYEGCLQTELIVGVNTSVQRIQQDGTTSATEEAITQLTFSSYDFCEGTSVRFTALLHDADGASSSASLESARLITSRTVEVERCQTVDGVPSCSTANETVALDLQWAASEDFTLNVSSYKEQLNGVFAERRVRSEQRQANVQGTVRLAGQLVDMQQGFGTLESIRQGYLTFTTSP